MTDQSRDPLEILKAAVDGLTYPSESDEPFDVFQWNNPRAASSRDALLPHVDRGRSIEQLSVNQFFEQLADSDDRDRFGRLRQTIVNLLYDPTVFRVGAGEVRVDVYLIGRLTTGLWAGLHTISVET
jgi:hypothetical protein